MQSGLKPSVKGSQISKRQKPHFGIPYPQCRNVVHQVSSTDITTKSYKIRSKFDAKLIAGFIKEDIGKY